MYQSSKTCGCVECSKWMPDNVYDYSLDKFGVPLCRPCQNRLKASSATSEARMLYLALKQHGIQAELEWSDGYKTIDIAILKHRLYIEVDGRQHKFNNKQAFSDLWRTYYAHRDGFTTLRIPNTMVRENIGDTVECLLKFLKTNNHHFRGRRW